MLQVLDEKVLKTDDEIESRYKNCKYLCILESYDSLGDNSGYLYCISTSEESLEELFDMRDRLQKEGKCCMIGGSYQCK